MKVVCQALGRIKPLVIFLENWKYGSCNVKHKTFFWASWKWFIFKSLCKYNTCLLILLWKHVPSKTLRGCSLKPDLSLRMYTFQIPRFSYWFGMVHFFVKFERNVISISLFIVYCHTCVKRCSAIVSYISKAICDFLNFFMYIIWDGFGK